MIVHSFHTQENHSEHDMTKDDGDDILRDDDNNRFVFGTDEINFPPRDKTNHYETCIDFLLKSLDMEQGAKLSKLDLN